MPAVVAFSAQIVALTLLALRMAQARGRLDEAASFRLVEGLRRLPRLVEEALRREPQVEEIARTKMPDLTASDMEAAVRTISGSARSAGIEVEGLE